MDDHVIGVLGGGQLGRMLVEAAHNLNIEIHTLDKPGAPAKQLLAEDNVNGSFVNTADVRALAAISDVLTLEIEHVNTEILKVLEEEQPTVHHTEWSRIQPSWRTIKIIQDKYGQKQHLARHSIPTAESLAVGTSVPQGVKDIAERLGGFPLMLKSRTDAYDGRGNYPLKSVSDIEPALKALGHKPLYAEKWAHFTMELAVMVVKHQQRSVATHPADPDAWRKATTAYPPVETVHEDSICKLVYAPPRSGSLTVLEEAQCLARRAVSTFAGCGVFGVELFLLDNGNLLVNEIAPRPHNSGHYTIEACQMSQYEAHLRAILPGLSHTIPADTIDFLTPNTHVIMLNILGGPTPDSHLLVARHALNIPGAKVHLYGKGLGRPGRKMGHVTLVASTMEEAEKKMEDLVDWVDALRIHRHASGTDTEIHQLIQTTVDHLRASKVPRLPKPLIGVTMGSDSDLHVLTPGLRILDTLEIPYSVTITSAHRTPDRMLAYARSAAGKGYRVLIAAAGGAAHLPGMLASATPLPIIGVPVKGKSLAGTDGLLSIVQMPRGVPVACVAVDGGVNACLLAVRILGASDERIREKMQVYMKNMEAEVLAKAEKLEESGWQEYTGEKKT